MSSGESVSLIHRGGTTHATGTLRNDSAEELVGRVGNAARGSLSDVAADNQSWRADTMRDGGALCCIISPCLAPFCYAPFFIGTMFAGLFTMVAGIFIHPGVMRERYINAYLTTHPNLTLEEARTEISEALNGITRDIKTKILRDDGVADKQEFATRVRNLIPGIANEDVWNILNRLGINGSNKDPDYDGGDVSF